MFRCHGDSTTQIYFFLNVELVLSCECCWIQNNRQKSIQTTFTPTDVHFAEMANAITPGSDGNPVINKTSKTETTNCSCNFFPFPEYDLKHMQTPKTINEPNRRDKHTPTCTYRSGERIQVTTNRLFLWILAGLEIGKKKTLQGNDSNTDEMPNLTAIAATSVHLISACDLFSYNPECNCLTWK